MQTRINLHFRKKVITRISIRVWTMIFERVQTGLVFVLRLNTILVFNIELRLDRGYRLLRFAWRTNLESVPRFPEIWKALHKITAPCTNIHWHFIFVVADAFSVWATAPWVWSESFDAWFDGRLFHCRNSTFTRRQLEQGSGGCMESTF